MARTPTFAPAQDLADDETEDFTVTAEEVALVGLQGLLASGKYAENPRAAVAVAWMEIVPEFMRQQANFPAFLQKIYGAPQEAEPAAAE